MTRLEIVPATSALLERFYSRTSPFTLRGHVVLKDGEPVALGGIYFDNEKAIAFSDIKPDRMTKREIAQGFRFLERQFARWPGPLFAICNPAYPNARRLLQRLGFQGQPELMVRV